MSGKTLRKEVDELLISALEATRAYPEIGELEPRIKRCRSTIAEPMRIAFIGGVNNGKSTLMNAFLGENLAATGNRELTYNVSWLRYGEHPELVIHNKDGGVERETFDSLEALTTRCEENAELLDRIGFLEVRYPAELLKEFDLVDTPGLYSEVRKDSDNTRRFLVDEDTRPHAVVFLFSDTLRARDIEELEIFNRMNGSPVTGITAVGALTKVDNFDAPLETGARIIDQVRRDHPWTLRSFYTIVPVMGHIGYGAQTLQLEEETTLHRLAQLPEKTTNKLLLDTRSFSESEYPDPDIPSAPARMSLAERLGVHGIRQALAMLREGKSMEIVRSELLIGSNVDRLRRIVISHFGNRAYLIKSRSALAAIREQAFYLGERLRGPAQAAAHRIVNSIDRIRAQDARFQEFTVLEKYYRGTLDLDVEHVNQLMDVTGENGTSCARRLGAGDNTPIAELISLAARRQGYWRSRGNELFLSEEVKEVAHILAQSYAEIHGRMLDAERHLEAAASLLAYEL